MSGLDAARRLHGGYWRYPFLDFHYLFNHYFPPPELIAELQALLPVLANSYPSGQPVLAQLLSSWKTEPYFAADKLVVGNGSSELIRVLLDRVISTATVPLPTFNEFVSAPDGRLHRYALDEADRFALDPERLIREARRAGSEYVILVNPNNPVGNLVERPALEQVLRSGLTVIVDEAFMAFTDGTHSAEPLTGSYENLIVVASCTKSIGIAGLRLGYLLTSNRRVLQTVRDALPIWNVNALAEHVLEAYPRFRECHRESLAQIRADTQWFEDRLRAVPYLEPYPTHTNAVFCRVHGSGRRLAELLFDRFQFIIKDGVQQAELRTVSSYVRLGVRNRSDNQRLLDALTTITANDLNAELEITVPWPPGSPHDASV